MNQYNRIMEQIQVTPAMLARLQHGVAARLEQQARMRRYRIAGLAAACLILIAGSTAVIHDNGLLGEPGGSEPPVVAVGGVQDFESMEALAASLSFPLSVPAVLPEGYAFESAANQFGMAVVLYTNGTASIKYCMGEGDAAVIGHMQTGQGHEIASHHAVLFGDAGQGYTSAEWEDGTYSYCILSDTPLTEHTWSEIIQSVAPASF